MPVLRPASCMAWRTRRLPPRSKQVITRSTPSALILSMVGPSASGVNPNARLWSLNANDTPALGNVWNETSWASPHDADWGDEPYDSDATFVVLDSVVIDVHSPVGHVGAFT